MDFIHCLFMAWVDLSSLVKMKILIVSPRFHTNMTMWIKTLIEKKHTVIINSLIKHEIEDYSLVTPKIFSLSIISKSSYLFLAQEVQILNVDSLNFLVTFLISKI